MTRMPRRYCTVCGKPFDDPYGYHVMCSDECGAQWDREAEAGMHAEFRALLPVCFRIIEQTGMHYDPSWGVVRNEADRGVYFVQAGAAGPIKIGVSADITARLKELQTASPYPLRLLATLDGATQKTETQLHQHFASARRHGEWFEPVPELLALINGIQ